jgi:hypothetical protein
MCDHKTSMVYGALHTIAIRSSGPRTKSLQEDKVEFH